MRRSLAWIAVLVVALGGGYFADNALRGYVEDRVAAAVSSEIGVDSTPVVDLGGQPFALALITRSVPDAHFKASSLPFQISGHDVRLTDASAETGQLRLVDDVLTVGVVAGAATLGYPDLAKVADVPIAYAGNGRLELRYNRRIFGRDLSFAVSAHPKLDVSGKVIRLSEPALDLAGNNIDLNLNQDQLDAIVEPIEVKLDHGLEVTSIVAGEAGVQVGIAGSDLSFRVP